MVKTLSTKKKELKELNTKLKTLQEKLIVAKKVEGVDDNISVKVQKNQARFDRVKSQDNPDKAVGKFYVEIAIKAKKSDVLVPLTVSSSKKPTGFIYRIEGTSEGTLKSATVMSRGKGVSEVTIGTMHYAKVSPGQTCVFRLQIDIIGQLKNTYKIIISRINYKLTLNDSRYLQYLKEIVSESIKFG